MTNRKQKLLAGLLIPTTVLATGVGVTALVIGAKTVQEHKNPLINGRTITFSAGEGRFARGQKTKIDVEAGTHLDRIEQPVVQSMDPNKIFAGWVDEFDNPVGGQQAINTNMTLKAVYNSTTDEYRTITFKATDSKQVIQGNTRVAVNKGYYFFMVNRPSATWQVDESTKKYFKGWAYEGTEEIISENQKINDNITLVPIFNEAVTITWHPDGKHEEDVPTGAGAIKRGQDTTTLEQWTPISQFNQPQLYFINAGTEQSGAYFAGWQTKIGDTYVDIDESWPVESNMDLYARWAKEPGAEGQFGIATFIEKPRSTDVDGNDLPDYEHFNVTFTPTTKIVIRMGIQWGQTNRPSSVSSNADYKVGGWEYTNVATPTEDDWYTLDDSHAFAYPDDSTIKIRPVMKKAIDSITVYEESGNDTIVLGKTNHYNVNIVGGATTRNKTSVTWSVLAPDGSVVPDYIATISNASDTAGDLTFKSISRAVYDEWADQHGATEKLIVRAVSKLDNNIDDEIEVKYEMPYVGNKLAWFHDESSADTPWYSFDVNEVSQENNFYISCTKLGDESASLYFHKDGMSGNFDKTIIFGDQLATIPAGFLHDWDHFTGNINFEQSNVLKISDDFLVNCVNFNNALTLPSNLIMIGDNFMKGCTSFNKPINLSNFQYLSEIGENFLGGCTAFNSKLSLPSLNELRVGNNFLYGCTAFNKALTLPSNLVSLGSFAMTDCLSFKNTLTVDCEPETVIGPSVHNFSSSTDETAGIVTSGFSVEGEYAQAFKEAYPTRKTEAPYRQITGGTEWDGQVDSETFQAAYTQLKNATNFDATLLVDDANVIYTYWANQAANADKYSHAYVSIPYFDLDLYVEQSEKNDNILHAYLNDAMGEYAGLFYQAASREDELINTPIQMKDTILEADPSGFTEFEYNSTYKAYMYRNDLGGYYGIKFSDNHHDQIGKLFIMDSRFNYLSQCSYNNIGEVDQPTLAATKVDKYDATRSETHEPADPYTATVDRQILSTIPAGFEFKLDAPTDALKLDLKDADGNNITGLTETKWNAMKQTASLGAVAVTSSGETKELDYTVSHTYGNNDIMIIHHDGTPFEQHETVLYFPTTIDDEALYIPENAVFTATPVNDTAEQKTHVTMPILIKNPNVDGTYEAGPASALYFQMSENPGVYGYHDYAKQIYGDKIGTFDYFYLASYITPEIATAPADALRFYSNASNKAEDETYSPIKVDFDNSTCELYEENAKDPWKTVSFSNADSIITCTMTDDASTEDLHWNGYQFTLNTEKIIKPESGAKFYLVINIVYTND